jgi:16S rRNA (adenine1518-N6/adenine1519-N6)-dimethyltransferase
MSLLAQHGLHPRHDLGQNFLIDLNLLEFLVEQAEITSDDVVLEVGAGTGSLTAILSAAAGQVVSVEYDARICPLAEAAVAGRTNVLLLNQDVLHNKNQLAPEVLAAVESAVRQLAARTSQPRLLLVANLPYCVATPVISNLLATSLPWERMVVTIQYELAQRMIAPPGSEHYSALSVWLQAQTNLELLRKLRPEVFWPRPSVDSAIVRITRNPELQRRIDNRDVFQRFVRQVFSQRRKGLRGLLRAYYGSSLPDELIDAAYQGLGVDTRARAEQLSAPVLVELSNRLLGRVPQ